MQLCFGGDKIRRQRGNKRHLFARRVQDSDGERVERQTLKPEHRLTLRRVQLVAHNRVLDSRAMDADLVRTAGLGERFYIRAPLSIYKSLPHRRRLAHNAVRASSRTRPLASAGAPYRLADDAPLLFERAVDKRAVYLFYLAVLKLLFEELVCLGGLGYHQHTGSLPVDAVHKVMLFILFFQPVGEGRILVLAVRVDNHPRRLVHYGQRVVLKEYCGLHYLRSVFRMLFAVVPGHRSYILPLDTRLTKVALSSISLPAAPRCTGAGALNSSEGSMLSEQPTFGG